MSFIRHPWSPTMQKPSSHLAQLIALARYIGLGAFPPYLETFPANIKKRFGGTGASRRTVIQMPARLKEAVRRQRVRPTAKRPGTVTGGAVTGSDLVRLAVEEALLLEPRPRYEGLREKWTTGIMVIFPDEVLRAMTDHCKKCRIPRAAFVRMAIRIKFLGEDPAVFSQEPS